MQQVRFTSILLMPFECSGSESIIRKRSGKTSSFSISSAIRKGRAEEVLSRLGIPMSTAIDMYLNQISLTGGIPFAVTLPKAPNSINMDLMTTEELHAKLQQGFSSYFCHNQFPPAGYCHDIPPNSCNTPFL